MIHGGIRWARDHNENCSKNGCADCATAEGVIALADRRELEVQTEISNRKIKAVTLKPKKEVDPEGNEVIVEPTKKSRKIKF